MKSSKKEYPDRIEYQNEQGECHRTDGPAVEWNNGDRSWWINGKRHREDGPAIERKDGTKFWWIKGNEYSEQDYYQEVTKIKLKRILDL